MYPQRELTRLAAYKTALLQDINRNRAQCAKTASRLAHPLELLDRAVAFWRRLLPLAPYVALPLGFLVQRTIFSKLKIVRPLMRWGPIIFAAFRGIRSMGTTSPKSSRH